MTTFTQALDQFRVKPSRDGARQVLQFCQARPERYAQLRDDDEAMIHFEMTEDHADPMKILAEHYAECWNALEDGGLEPTEEALWEVEEELAGGGWTVHRDDDDGRWKVSADEEFEAPRSVAYHRDGSPDRYEWITIGGHPEEPDKKHVGGFPVEIDADGTILKSRAPGLQGKHIGQVKGNIGKKKNVDQPDPTGVKPDEPESGWQKTESKDVAPNKQETGSEPEEKPKWNAESTAIRHIAGSTGLEKNDVIAQIAQIAMKTGWGTAKIAGRIAKTLGKHALGTVGIGSGKRASMILDLVDDLLGKDNAVTNAAMGRNVDDKQSSAVLDAVDAMFGKDNPLSTAHHQVKPEKKKEKPKESSAVLDVVDAVLGKGNAVTNAVMNEGGGETSPQSSVLLDAVDAVAGKGNAVSNAASGIGGGSKQSSLLLDIWDSIAGKGNKVTDWLMRQEHDGKAYRRELLDAIDAAASECETEPTDAQKESGNYKKGHVTIQGLPITIENPKGSIRRGKGWQTKMKAHYGYVKRTESEADGDHVDVFIGPDPQSEIVFVVDQLTKGGRFDEHKCILPGQHLQGNILAASKSIYSGKAIKLRCASGNTLSVTPNHPVMTLRGLVAAGDLREGDNLLAYVGKSELAASRDDEKYVPTVVEKVFGTLKKLNPLCFSREFVSALDFHGDAKFFNGKIDVVRANSKLGSDNESDFSESFTHQNLVGSLATPTVLTGDSSFHSCFETVDPASIRRSGNISDSFSSFGQLSGSETGDFESYRFGETSDVDLALLQSIGDDANINVISDSEILGRLPINVSLDEIIGIDVVHYDGPVYDFRSTTGLIVVNRLVISNCMIGYTSAKDAKEGYLANYSPGWTGYGGCKAMPMEVFKEWIKSGDTGSKVQAQKIEYARVDGEIVLRYGWTLDTKTKSKKKKWVNSSTGESRYQEKMPGDRSGRKKAVRTGEGTPKPKKAKATKTVDKEALREKLQPYEGGLNEVQSKSAKASFKALMRHHSDKVTSRLSELVDDAFAGLGKAKTEEARQKWTSKLGQYRQMLEWAGAGVKDSVQTKDGERALLVQRVIAKFGGDEQKYSSYSTEQLRKMLEGGTKGETNDDTNSSQLDGDGELSGGGGEDQAGSTVGTDAGQASTGVLSPSGDGDGRSLSGLPDGEGQPGAGASAVPGIGEWDGTARGEGGSSAGASTGAGGTGGSSGGSGTEGDRSGGVPDVPGSDGQTKQVVKKKPTAETPTDLAAGNFRYTDTQAFMQGGLKTKFQRNIEAIRTLKMLQEEGRQATPAEQEILSKFIGWGQFPAAFERGYGDDQIGWQEKEHLKKYLTEEEWDARFAPSKWEKEKELLKSLLTDDEYKAARKSTLNAHYTHPDVVKAHWKMAERLGFKGGKFLETSAGAGYYMGMMPGELAGRTRVNAVELDPITAAICKQLYPKANVENTGFEKFANPDGFYELVASNVPFGDYSIFEKRYAKYGAKIHDHFFLKSLDLAKPGGLVMHVTSTGTLDKQDATIRKALAEGAEFVGAVRFPGSTHKKNAGTDVVTDMVILRKKNPKIPATTDETPKEAKPKGQGFTGTTIDSLGRLYYWQDGKRVPGPSWLETTTVPDPAGGDPIHVNKYFADHPEQVLGTLDRTGTMYRADSKNVSLTDDFEARLEAAIQRLPEGAMRTDVDEPEAEKVRADDHTGKENSLVSKDGKIYVYQNGMLTEQKTTKEERQKIEQLLAIRDARNLLVANQIEGTSSAESRKKLNELYDAYVAKNGIIHSKKNMDLMGDDPDLDNLLALERYDKKTKKATKADMLVKDTIRSGKIVEKAENITEAVGVSLHMHGLLDVGYMSKILGMTKDEVGGLLAESGLAFNDPKEGWKQNDQYLSGNVRKKLIEAKAAAAVDPAFRRNVEALEAVQPADIPYDQITIKMGARWVPESDMQNFAVDLFGGQADMYEFRVNPIDSKWSFDIPKNYNRQRLLNGELAARWGTDRVGPSTVLNAALNNTLITVSDKDSDGKSYVNKEATDAANEKVKNMRDQFSKEFVWEDEERRERLSRYYNDNFNNIVPIKYDGSHQTFPGQNAAWKLYPHQKDAVWQIVTTGKGLLAHEVGTGKSATMFTSAMELRRLGLAKKPAIVCLKTNIAALTEEARQLYPGAKILSTLDSFDAKSRKKTMAQIATGDYDMVFMTHEHLGFMKMKPDTQKAFLQKELDQIMESMAAAASEHGNADYSVKQLEAAALKVQAKMQSSMDDSKKDDTVYFEDSGIDQIMVDEAHYFKNLGVYSKNQIKGIPTATSDRALDMYMRSSWLMEKNNGRGVVFATGTPVSNSMAELYVMQKYLQEKELKESGINNFDDWANMYGDTQTKQEYTMTGEYKPVTRFSEFTNVPELLNQARQVMDVVRVDSALDEHGKPTVTRPERKDAAEVAPPLPNTAQFLADLQRRARSLGRDRKSDNMLKICTDAKKFSVDMRLIDQNAEDYPESKVNILVNKTIELWKQHPDKVQFIFSDAGVHETDTNSFTCYDDITQKLIDAGIPADKIKNFGKIDTEKQKEEAVQALRSGEALIAIGGTKKLGTGVNAQNKMIAIHHLDVPMKPAEIEQREGRGWRSGNQNKEINIIKYVAQPMDQFFWGLVSRKDKFIKKVIIDKNPPRNIEELEDADDLSPDRLAAIASGNPLRVRQVELEYDEKKLADSERRHTTEQRRLVASEKGSLAKIARFEEEAKKSRKLDQELPKKEEMPTTVKVGDKEYDNQKEADEALKARIAETANLNSWEEETIGEYAGMPIIRKQNRDFSQGIRTYIETPIGEIPFNDSIQSLKLKISGARNDYKNTELAIEEVKKGMAKVKESVGKPYANAEKLAMIRAELKKIAEELAPKKDDDTTTVAGSGSAALDDYLKDVKKDGGEDPRGQTIIKKPQAVIPPTSEFTSIHDVDTRVKSFGKAIKAPADSVKLASGKTATGHAVGPFVIRKEGDGKNTRYIVTHKGTGFNAVTADTMSVANVAAHAMAKKGDWSFTDASKFTGETREHGGKVVRAVNSGNMQDLADLAGIGEHTVQRNQRMPWNFKTVLNEFRSSPDADGARKVLRYCAADVSRYAMIEDADAANIEYELTPEEGGADHFRVLAEFYADHWNQLERAGLEPSNDGLSKAADELANGDWVVFFDEDDMEWRVIHAEAAPHVVKYAAAKNLHTYSCPRCKGIAYADSPVMSGRFNGYAICSRCGHSFATVNRHQAVDEVLYYATKHAPKGGVTINGKFWKPEWSEKKERYSLIDVILRYARRQAPKGGVQIGGKTYKGGQWIPAEVMAKATPKEKAAITKAATPSAKATTPGAGKAVSPKQVAKASAPKSPPVAKKEAVKWNAASKRKKADPKAKILELAKGMNTASIPEIRAKMPVELRGKEFDDAIIALADDRKIQVHSDALPESFSPEERANLTSLGNNVFTSFSVTPSVGMDMVNKSAIPEEAKKDIGELHNEFMKMDPEQQQRILQNLEAAARKYDQKQNLSKFVSTRAYAGLSPSQRKNAEEAFMILDPEQQAEQLEVLKSMTPEQIDDAVRQANELDRQKHNTKPDTITWGGVKGGRFKPEELKYDEDEDLTQMSEDDLWNAFVGEQGGNPHLPKHQWTPRAHKLMDAWRKKSEEVEAAANTPVAPKAEEPGLLSKIGDAAGNVASTVGGAALDVVKRGLKVGRRGQLVYYQRGGVLRHFHQGLVLRYEWVEVPTKAKTKKWKDSATGRTRYQPTQPGVGRGGGIMSKGVQATATTGGTITRTKERGARGQVDREKLKQLLQPHGHHELDEKQMKKTKSQFRALAGHHKELVHHRLEELANGMQSALEKLPDNAKNRETRQEIGRKLRAISHMTEWADAKHPQQTKKEPSVGKLSSKINSGKFNLAERGKGLKPSELKQYPTEKQEMKHADPVMQKHQEDHDAYLEAQAKKTLHVPTGKASKEKGQPKSMWDIPENEPPKKGANVSIMRSDEEKEGLKEPAKSSVQTEPAKPKSGWNEPQKRVKQVHEVAEKVATGKASKKELDDVTRAINDRLKPADKPTFWKRVVKGIKNKAALAMVMVSMWSAANAGVAETKEIASGNKDPVDKSALAFELHKRAEGMAGKPREQRPGIVKTTYQRAE